MSITVKDRASHYPMKFGHKPRPPKTQLERDVAAAAAAGMSYGQYKALHPNTPQPPKQQQIQPVPDASAGPTVPPLKTYHKACAFCGQEFESHNKSRIYCCDRCGAKARQSRKQKPPKKQKIYHKVCPVCGEEFTATHNQSIYCSTTCRYKANNNPARRYDRG